MISTTQVQSITEAQRFVRDLVSDWSLFTALVKTERQVAKHEEYRTQLLDNFLTQHGYRTTIEHVATTGQETLSDLGVWNGHYRSEVAPPNNPGRRTAGPAVVIEGAGSSANVHVDGHEIEGFTFSMLDLSWEQEGSNPHAGSILLHRSQPPGASAPENQFMGTLTTNGTVVDWSGVVGRTNDRGTGKQSRERPRTPSEIEKVQQILHRVMQGINAALMVAQVIMKVRTAILNGKIAAEDAAESAEGEEIDESLESISDTIRTVNTQAKELAELEGNEAEAADEAANEAESTSEEAAENAAEEAMEGARGGADEGGAEAEAEATAEADAEAGASEGAEAGADAAESGADAAEAGAEVGADVGAEAGLDAAPEAIELIAEVALCLL
ncbi:MAG: hypothetical protein K0V04_14755 [Deltaproteobacteria bacterium]|nr:hypothetical protein [Deltaproteobacteria bacterium]